MKKGKLRFLKFMGICYLIAGVLITLVLTKQHEQVESLQEEQEELRQLLKENWK
jgi:hypothetical protein